MKPLHLITFLAESRLRSLLILVLLIIPPAAAVAQSNPKPSPTPKTDEQERVRVFTEEVRLPVLATDAGGHYDAALVAGEVLVLEDGKPQQIRSIQHPPTNVLLLLDVGNTLGVKDTNLTRALATRVIGSLHPEDRITLMQFATRPELLQDWTTDRAALARVLAPKGKLIAGKNSRLTDAIAAASAQFKDTPPGTRHIVLITDGVEAPGGRISLSEAIRQLNSVQVTVHVISYTALARTTLQTNNKIVRGGDGVQRDSNPKTNPVANGDPRLPPGATRTPVFKIGSIDTDEPMRRKRKEYERATKAAEQKLTEIAEDSGGRIIISETPEDLLAQADSITRDIGAQYVITYRPTRPLSAAKTAEYRRVEVVSRRAGLYLRSRKGYVVPAQE
ncbi:MAG TPA: VWA domain-containing protein [Pyrinomonadaceae bacterium]|nr:VWA domain-containing protein [Pyrinomonadaceae bacterium]